MATSASIRISTLGAGNAVGPLHQAALHLEQLDWSCTFPPDTNTAICSIASFAAGAEAAIEFSNLSRVWEVEVSAAGQPDPDSTPDNHVTTEDDFVTFGGP